MQRLVMVDDEQPATVVLLSLPREIALATTLRGAHDVCEQLRVSMQRYDTNHAYPIARYRKGGYRDAS